jgi:hypothetical protein
VVKPDSRKAGISCACVADDTIYAYTFEVDGSEIHSYIETYTLTGELLKKVSADAVRSRFSDSREAVMSMAVCDRFIFLWTSFAGKFVPLEWVDDELIPVDFPLEKAALGYLPPPCGADNSCGYMFTDEALIRYDKETKTFRQQSLPQSSRRWINEQGQLLLAPPAKKSSEYYLFDNLSWQ